MEYDSVIDFDTWYDRYEADIIEIVEEEHNIKFDMNIKEHAMWFEAELQKKWENDNNPESNRREE